MKATHLLALPLLALSSAAFAQTAKPAPFVAQPVSADQATREMSNRLRLNEGQYLKLSAVNRTRETQIKQINNTYRNDEATRAAKMAELDAQYQQECSRILTPSQLSQLYPQQAQPATEPTPAPATGNGLG